MAENKTLTQDEYSELKEILALAQDADDSLSENEADLVDKLTEREASYGIRMFISEGQWEFLRLIGRKLGAVE